MKRYWKAKSVELELRETRGSAGGHRSQRWETEEGAGERCHHGHLVGLQGPGHQSGEIQGRSGKHHQQQDPQHRPSGKMDEENNES